jgi:Leucine-rich repeat (LRR) protein
MSDSRTPDYSITELDISNKDLAELPKDIYKYTNLQILYCGYNELNNLDNLPTNLMVLHCNNNKIISLDNLPITLKELHCRSNPFTYDFKPTLENIRKYNAPRILSS